MVLFLALCLLESVQSRKPASQKLGLGKSPAVSSLQVIYSLLWVCFPSCTRRANPAAFPEGSAGAALSNLRPEIEALQKHTKGHLWGHGRQMLELCPGTEAEEE